MAGCADFAEVALVAAVARLTGFLRSVKLASRVSGSSAGSVRAPRRVATMIAVYVSSSDSVDRVQWVSEFAGFKSRWLLMFVNTESAGRGTTADPPSQPKPAERRHRISGITSDASSWQCRVYPTVPQVARQQ